MYKSFCVDGLIVLQEINCTFSNSWKMSSVLPLYWMTHPKCQVKALFRTLFRCVSKVIMELIILKILSKYFHVCVLFRYWRCFWIFGVFMGFFFLFVYFFKTHVKLDFLTPAIPRHQLDCFVDLLAKSMYFSDYIVIYSAFPSFGIFTDVLNIM